MGTSSTNRTHTVLSAKGTLGGTRLDGPWAPRYPSNQGTVPHPLHKGLGFVVRVVVVDGGGTTELVCDFFVAVFVYVEELDGVVEHAVMEDGRGEVRLTVV